MCALRLALAGTLGLVLLGGPGGVTMAQDESEAIEVPAPAIVTGTAVLADHCRITSSGEDLDEPGVHRWRDMRWECRIQASDPRVSGTYSVVLNGDIWETPDAGITWGTSRLDGPDGGWDCSFTGIGDPYPSSPVDDLYLWVCPGTGDYQDLTWVWYWGQDGAEGFGDGVNIVGFIYQGDPPPLWGPGVE